MVRFYMKNEKIIPLNTKNCPSWMYFLCLRQINNFGLDFIDIYNRLYSYALSLFLKISNPM